MAFRILRFNRIKSVRTPKIVFGAEVRNSVEVTPTTTKGPDDVIDVAVLRWCERCRFFLPVDLDRRSSRIDDHLHHPFIVHIHLYRKMPSLLSVASLLVAVAISKLEPMVSR
jgi:hypothetical protein